MSAETRNAMIKHLRGVLDDAIGNDSREGAEAFLRLLHLAYIDPALVAAVEAADANNPCGEVCARCEAKIRVANRAIEQLRGRS